jgi:hypothetical protein
MDPNDVHMEFPVINHVYLLYILVHAIFPLLRIPQMSFCLFFYEYTLACRTVLTDSNHHSSAKSIFIVYLSCANKYVDRNFLDQLDRFTLYFSYFADFLFVGHKFV